MLTLDLPKNLEKRLGAVAKRAGQSKAHIVHEAILEYVEELEDAYLAVERLESTGKRLSQEEVERSLGLVK